MAMAKVFGARNIPLLTDFEFTRHQVKSCRLQSVSEKARKLAVCALHLQFVTATCSQLAPVDSMPNQCPLGLSPPTIYRLCCPQVLSILDSGIGHKGLFIPLHCTSSYHRILHCCVLLFCRCHRSPLF